MIMGRQSTLSKNPELREKVAQDLASGKTRKQVCEENGLNYQQLQKAFGFAWKRGSASSENVVADTPTGETV
jgi:hypothetical protein